MTRKFSAVLIFLSFIWTTIAKAQESITPTTLQELWNEAEKNNKQLQVDRIQLDKAKIKTAVIREDNLPDVGISGEFSGISNMPVFTNGLFHSPQYNAVVHRSASVEAEATYNLFNGNKHHRSVEQSLVDEQIAQESLAKSRVNMRYEIAANYLDVYRNRQYLAYLEKDIAERENHLANIRNLYEKGVVLKSDVLRAELSLNQQKESYDETKNNITIATQAINRLAGGPANRSIVPTLDFSPLEDRSEPLASNFDLRILQLESEKSHLELRKVKSNTLPKVDLFAHYGMSYPQVLFYPYEIAWYGLGMVGVKAHFSLTNLYSNKRKKQEVQADVAAKQLKELDYRDRYEEECSKLRIRYQQEINKIAIAKKNIAAAEESYRIMKNSYFGQLALLTDFLQAEAELLQARFDYTTEMVNAELLKYQLLKITGKL